MMKFEQYGDYPKCAAFNRVYLNIIEMLKPNVYKAFVQFCGDETRNGDEALARQALSFGENPLVRIVTLTDSEGNELGTMYPGNYKGVCDNKLRDVVFINR